MFQAPHNLFNGKSSGANPNFALRRLFEILKGIRKMAYEKQIKYETDDVSKRNGVIK